MIKLTKLITDIVTDTIFVSDIRFDMTTGTVFATLRRGTTDAQGNFIENFKPLQITVQPDGSFNSDGAFSGTPGTIPVQTLVSSLGTQLDQMIQSVLNLY